MAEEVAEQVPQEYLQANPAGRAKTVLAPNLQ